MGMPQAAMMIQPNHCLEVKGEHPTKSDEYWTSRNWMVPMSNRIGIMNL